MAGTQQPCVFANKILPPTMGREALMRPAVPPRMALRPTHGEQRACLLPISSLLPDNAGMAA